MRGRRRAPAGARARARESRRTAPITRTARARGSACARSRRSRPRGSARGRPSWCTPSWRRSACARRCASSAGADRGDASRPSISGICTSISTRSNVSRGERGERLAARARDDDLVPLLLEQAHGDQLWLTALSSARSTEQRARAAPRGARRPATADGPRRARAERAARSPPSRSPGRTGLVTSSADAERAAARGVAAGARPTVSIMTTARRRSGLRALDLLDQREAVQCPASCASTRTRRTARRAVGPRARRQRLGGRRAPSTGRMPQRRAARARMRRVGGVVVDDQDGAGPRERGPDVDSTGGRGLRPRPKRAVKWNVLPAPGSLSTQIRPPISSTSCAEMVRPRPVPPYCAWSSRRPARRPRRSAAACPAGCRCRCRAPRSAGTATGRLPSATSTATRRPRPRSVNLMALPTRLTRTWRSRPGRRRSASGTSGAMRQASSSPFWCARSASVLSVSPRPSREARRRRASSSSLPPRSSRSRGCR